MQCRYVLICRPLLSSCTQRARPSYQIRSARAWLGTAIISQVFSIYFRLFLFLKFVKWSLSFRCCEHAASPVFNLYAQLVPVSISANYAGRYHTILFLNIFLFRTMVHSLIIVHCERPYYLASSIYLASVCL